MTKEPEYPVELDDISEPEPPKFTAEQEETLRLQAEFAKIGKEAVALVHEAAERYAAAMGFKPPAG